MMHIKNSPYSNKIINFLPISAKLINLYPIFVQFTCFVPNLLFPTSLSWPWCIYASCFMCTGRLWCFRRLKIAINLLQYIEVEFTLYSKTSLYCTSRFNIMLYIYIYILFLYWTDRVLRSAARLISHIPKYASVSAYMRDDSCTGFLSPNAFCIGSQHLSGDL